MKIGVSEIFESIQGEGPSMGRHAVFLRLAGCNLLCGGKGTDKDKQLHDGATWRCDTIEVWQNSNLMELEDLKKEIFNEIYADPLSTGCHLIITGGEPLLWDRQLVALLGSIPESDLPYIEIETNETRFASDPNKIGAILSELTSVFSIDDLISTMGLSEDDICTYSEMSNFDWDKYTNDGTSPDPHNSDNKLTLILSDSQYSKWRNWANQCSASTESMPPESALELLLDTYASINQK